MKKEFAAFLLLGVGIRWGVGKSQEKGFWKTLETRLPCWPHRQDPRLSSQLCPELTKLVQSRAPGPFWKR